MIGITAVDPGTHTGVARGLFDKSDSVWDGISAGDWETYEVTGPPADQAWEIMGEFLDWRKALCSGGTPVTTVLVVEDFVVRLGQGASSKRELLDPVRVASAMEALCITRSGLRWMTIEYQQPSEMVTYSSDRLRAHDLWIRGAGDHRHDALKHMIRRYAAWIKS